VLLVQTVPVAPLIRRVNNCETDIQRIEEHIVTGNISNRKKIVPLDENQYIVLLVIAAYNAL